MIYQSVDLDINDKKNIPDVNPTNKVGEFGPGNDSAAAVTNAENRQKVVGVFFGPGLYQTIESLTVLECFERLDLPVHVVSGVGMSSLIALLYAQGMSLQNIEWQIFKSLRENKYKPYSEKWLEQWRHFFAKNIDLKKIKLSNRTALIPSLIGDNIALTNRFHIKDVFEINFNLRSRNFHLKKNLISLQLDKGNLVDKLIYVNFLRPSNFQSRENEYLKGLFLKSYSLFQKAEKNGILILDLSSNFDIEESFSSTRVDKQKVCSQIRSAL